MQDVTLAFYPKARMTGTQAGLLTLLLRSRPSRLNGSGFLEKVITGAYSSGNCPRFSRDSLLIPPKREPGSAAKVTKRVVSEKQGRYGKTTVTEAY